jgi:type VI secretion system secreted protein Hcp
MKYDGIDGDVTAKGHEKWIECLSFQMGVNRSVHTPVGAAADREASAPSVSEVVLTKNSDASSYKLFQESLVGEGDKKVKIDFCKTATDLDPYNQYELEQVVVSGWSASSGGDRAMESLTLNFTKITYVHFPMDQKGVKAGNPTRVNYNLATAQKG